MPASLEVGAYEAKTKLGSLLDEVEKGRQVTITRHGVAVAILTPASRPAIPALAETAAAIRAFRKGRRLEANLHDLIAEGRR